MNERIRELALQAGFMEAWFSESGDDCEREITKLAELIVRECAEFIAPLGDYCGGHGEPSAPSSRECARRLKQHFGVEE